MRTLQLPSNARELGALANARVLRSTFFLALAGPRSIGTIGSLRLHGRARVIRGLCGGSEWNRGQESGGGEHLHGFLPCCHPLEAACPLVHLVSRSWHRNGARRLATQGAQPRRSACHTPAQLPSDPPPCHVPLPSPRNKRPWPSACWPIPSTLTRTTPFERTWPCTSTGPPPS